MTNTDSRAADELFANILLLERLAAYARDPRDVTAPRLPSLTQSEQEFLASDDRGAAAAQSWLRAFRSTLDLLLDFRAGELDGTLRYASDEDAERDLQSAKRASTTAIDAAVSRIRFMAGRAGGPPAGQTA